MLAPGGLASRWASAGLRCGELPVGRCAPPATGPERLREGISGYSGGRAWPQGESQAHDGCVSISTFFPNC